MRTRARSLTGALALFAALTLAGCAVSPQPVVTRLPSDGSAVETTSPSTTSSFRPTSTPTVSATTTAPVLDETDCAGAEKNLAGSSQTFTLTGDCPVVRIEGNAVTVDASDATVGTVTISGDRIRLDAAILGDTTVQGNDTTVNAPSAGTLVIRGDRNTVSAPGGSVSLSISGNDNVVIAPSAEVVDEGQRNSIR